MTIKKIHLMNEMNYIKTKYKVFRPNLYNLTPDILYTRKILPLQKLRNSER